MDEFNVVATLNITVTQENIDDIMCAALEGGITYWCGEAEVVGDYLGECSEEQIARGGTLILYDAESDDKWELNRDKLLAGLKMYIENGGAGCVDDESLDTSYIDADAADSIVQYGLFGELVFG